MQEVVDPKRSYLKGIQVVMGSTANALELLSPVHQLVRVVMVALVCANAIVSLTAFHDGASVLI